ncbi:type IV pilus modification protein PilV [Acinetobacter sp. HY1485]|uniref:type IV pilus modification protein PilV n=1 Tax=Acinetobacter sp. HY1485 TaxID=2970918 RepID=UPI0022B9972F|nr:type IV pilus modification protein PilV [Acinetobacter sp. HY1485]
MKSQQGVGLVEVLVALLLVSIAVLGFVALQYRAAEAGNEASSRVIASEIARDIAEKIRINGSKNAIKIYTQQTTDTSSKNCNTETCTDIQKARFDLSESQAYAANLGMQVAVNECPNTPNQRRCIYVAWDKTDTTNMGASSCTETVGNTFHYRAGSTCIVMEVM